MTGVADIQCVFQSITGVGSIYISNITAARDLSLLKKKNICAIITAARNGQVAHPKQDVPFYLLLPAIDAEQYPIEQFFAQAYEFIERARTETNILVHCMMGISRSATIVIAYLIKKYKYTLGKVYSLIQRKRNKIEPNPGFMAQLKKYADSEGVKGEERQLSFQKNSTSRHQRTLSLKQVQTFIKKTRQNKILASDKNELENYKGCSTAIAGDLPSTCIGKTKQTQQDAGSKLVSNHSSIFQSKNEKPELQASSLSNELGKARPSIEQKINKVREKYSLSKNSMSFRHTRTVSAAVNFAIANRNTDQRLNSVIDLKIPQRKFNLKFKPADTFN